MFWFVIDWNILLYINFLRSVRGIKWIEMLYVDDWKRVLDWNIVYMVIIGKVKGNTY